MTKVDGLENLMMNVIVVWLTNKRHLLEPLFSAGILIVIREILTIPNLQSKWLEQDLKLHRIRVQALLNEAAVDDNHCTITAPHKTTLKVNNFKA